jgi:DNA adenine methylase
MRASLDAISALLRGKTIVTPLSYEKVLANVRGEDVVYMDPPYQGVCGERDSRYFTGISFDDFVAQLAALNLKNVRYLVSYDGRSGNRTYGNPLPAKLDLALVEIEAGRSSQATLLGRDEVTVESLYLSRALAEELGVQPAMHRRRHGEQMQLMETPMIDPAAAFLRETGSGLFLSYRQ